MHAQHNNNDPPSPPEANPRCDICKNCIARRPVCATTMRRHNQRGHKWVGTIQRNRTPAMSTSTKRRILGASCGRTLRQQPNSHKAPTACSPSHRRNASVAQHDCVKATSARPKTSSAQTPQQRSATPALHAHSAHFTDQGSPQHVRILIHVDVTYAHVGFHSVVNLRL